MVQDTCASRLLAIDGLAVVDAVDGADVMVVQVVTAQVVACCVGCGTPSVTPKGKVTTRPRDLPCFGRAVRMIWHKRRWYCRAAQCPRKTFTETVPQIPARRRMTVRLRQSAGRAVCDGGRTVAQAAFDHQMSWPVTQAAFEQTAAQSLPAEPPATAAIGIDEIRRGKPRWEPDPQGGGWRQCADRWHAGFVDLTGTHGLLGQVEGRTAAAVGGWLAERSQHWRDQVKVVAIDMYPAFRKAVTEQLPHATLVVDHFHVVQLANQVLAEVRRRTTATMRGRRARKDDPEYGIRRRLTRNREDLTDESFTNMWTRLDRLGPTGDQIKIAYIAKEELRRLLRLAYTFTTREQIRAQLHEFYSWCAEDDIPELHRLATTIETWWPQIEAFLHLPVTNAASEGINRVLKLEARNAYGFRNTVNQRLRCQAASTRRQRRDQTRVKSA